MLSMIWGWTVLACPAAFVAGFVWIQRASELETPVNDVPTAGQWLLISMGVAGLFIVLGMAILFIGPARGGASVFASVAMFALVVGPLWYCVHTYRWVSKVRRKLKEQRRKLSAQQPAGLQED